MLLGDGQRGRVDPLVDHLSLPRLEREQTLSCVTHPAPGTHTRRERRRNNALIALAFFRLLIFAYLFIYFFCKNDFKRPPSGLEGEPGGVSSIAAQRAERPHDQLEAGVVDVPQVDVLVGDLHGALAVDVQVGGGHQVDVEALWR